MRYRQLGRTGVYVSELGLGTMTFGGRGFWSSIGCLGQTMVDTLLERSLDAGINFIDTADAYSDGHAEELLGQGLASLGVRRTDVVVATKAYGAMGAGPNDRGASRLHLLDALSGSLERLRLDYVDLYQLHAFDPVTALDETLRALDDVVSQGLARYIGCSNWAAWQLMKALGISDRHGWARFETLQAYYSIAGRDLEREILPLLEDQRLGLLVWSPLAGGLLSGKFTRDQHGPPDSRRAKLDFPPVDLERTWRSVERMQAIAARHGVSVARVALAWLLAKPSVTSVIIGATSAEQLDDNIAAAELELATDEMAALDEVSQLPGEYPGWMLARQAAERRPGPFVARQPASDD